jgi:hypothetical protein
MDHNKFYREKNHGSYLGRFCFANEWYADGIDRMRTGTKMYFMPNNSKEWEYVNGICLTYSEFFDEDKPAIPYDIEETERVD